MTLDDIEAELLDYLHKAIPSLPADGEIPRDTSLYEIGILDSFGVVELVDFVEQRWNIKIHDSELTQENFGGIHKMAAVIRKKITAP